METDARRVRFAPGMRIKVTQRIDRREGPWDTEVVGTLISAEPEATGSWFAHGKRDKYWVVRLELQKEDGEITSVTLDQNTQITVLSK